jgi:hypothetical protein
LAGEDDNRTFRLHFSAPIKPHIALWESDDLEVGAKPMANTTIEELQSENKRLRDLVASLSVTLLRNIALDPPKYRRNAGGADAGNLLEEAASRRKLPRASRPRVMSSWREL